VQQKGCEKDPARLAVREKATRAAVGGREKDFHLSQ
jgi:hypothetical protein